MTGSFYLRWWRIGFFLVARRGVAKKIKKIKGDGNGKTRTNKKI